MKAIVCHEFGLPESLSFETMEPTPVGPGQVRIAVHACGVNFADTLVIQNKYQFKPSLPFSPGGEVAGKVVEVSDDVDAFSLGDRVIAVVGWGGYADELVTDAAAVTMLPEGMDFITGAGFTMTYGSSHYALKQRAALQPGETLLVLGASGGVGLAAVEVGKLMGARVIAAAGSDEKLEVCQAHGADDLLNYSNQSIGDRTKELTGGKGADVIYGAVGGDAFDEAMHCIAWNGRLLVVGFASGRIPEIPANLVLIKGCDIVGVFWSAFTVREPAVQRENFEELGAWYREGRLAALVSATYRLEDAAQALDAIRARKVTGKVVLTTGRS